MLALDTDVFAADACTGPQCLTAGVAAGFNRFVLGTARESLRDPGIISILKRARLRVDGLRGPRLEGLHGETVPAAALLTSPDPEAREGGVRLLHRSAALAESLGGTVITLPLGALPLIRDVIGLEGEICRTVSRDRALELLLPELFGLIRAHPEIGFAVEIAGDRSRWPMPADLDLMLSELRQRNFGWWHDTARAWRLASEADVPPSSWLDLHRGRLMGVTLRDAGGDEDGVPLGSGAVDFGPVREHQSSDLVLAVSMDARFGIDAVRESKRFLDGLGIG